jgi:putative spermidine/putrescine transport system permease protein
MKKRPSPLLFVALLLAGIFVVLPYATAADFSLRDFQLNIHSFHYYQWIREQPDFGHYLLVSLRLGLLAVAILLIILVPTAVWLNLSGQAYRPLVEFLTLLPLIIPVVALAIGAQNSFPLWLQSNENVLAFMYAVLALPYTFRTMDIGLRAIPLRTISEAARGLGANWMRTVLLVIGPTVRGAVFASLFLTLALSLGEFTMTSLLHWDTFTTWVTQVSQENIGGAIALSVFSLTAAFGLLLVISLFSGRTEARLPQEES